MTDLGFALFETALGPCGIAWGPRGIVGVQLPERDAARTRARMARRHPGAQEGPPPDEVAQAIAAIQALLAGERRGLSEVALDMARVGDFERRGYAGGRGLPPRAPPSPRQGAGRAPAPRAAPGGGPGAA